MADFIAISVRALGFVAALQAAGAPLFLSLFGGDVPRSTRAIQHLAGRTALAGLLLTIAYQVLEPARLTGELAGVFDGSMQALLLASDLGTATAVRVLGLAMVMLVWLRPSRFGAAAALAGSALVVASFAFMGHTAADDQRWLLAGLLILHLVLVAFWFGTLWPFYLVSRHETLATRALIVDRFSRLAVWLVPVIFIAGLAMSALLLPSLASLTTPYGLSLLAKISGFALLMALASLNKWRLGPRMSHGDEHAAHAFRRSLVAEWVLIAAVLTVTAVMTALFSPTH
jgi:putative copper resistance protein D